MLLCSLVFSISVTLTRLATAIKSNILRHTLSACWRQQTITFCNQKGKRTLSGSLEADGDLTLTPNNWGDMDVPCKEGLGGGRVSVLVTQACSLPCYTTHHWHHFYIIIHPAKEIQDSSWCRVMFSLPPPDSCLNAGIHAGKTRPNRDITKPRSISLLRAVFCFNVITTQYCLRVWRCNSAENVSSFAFL